MPGGGTMYDAVPGPADSIPNPAYAVAGYLNGLYTWSLGLFQRFNALWVPIEIYIPGRTTNGFGDGQWAADQAGPAKLGLPPGSTVVLDVEGPDVGGTSYQYSVGWVQGVKSRGYSPCIYTDRSHFGTMSPDGADDFWIAEWTGSPHSIPGAAACQWTDQGGGGNYDISLCNPGFPRRGGGPPPPPPPPPPGANPAGPIQCPPKEEVPAVVVLQAPTGEKAVFTVGTDGNVYVSAETKPGGPYGPYQMLSGPVPQGRGPVNELIARWDANLQLPEVYIQFCDAATFTSWLVTGQPAWQPWQRIGALPGQP